MSSGRRSSSARPTATCSAARSVGEPPSTMVAGQTLKQSGRQKVLIVRLSCCRRRGGACWASSRVTLMQILPAGWALAAAANQLAAGSTIKSSSGRAMAPT